MCFKPLVVYWKLCFIKLIQCYRKIPTMLLAVDGFLLFSTRFLFLLIWNWKTNILFLLYFLFFCFFGLFSFFRLNLLLCASSTCFLMGPFNQIKKMFASTRVIATIIVIVSLILTLVAAIVVRFLFLFFIWLFYFFILIKLIYCTGGGEWGGRIGRKPKLNSIIPVKYGHHSSEWHEFVIRPIRTGFLVKSPVLFGRNRTHYLG